MLRPIVQKARRQAILAISPNGMLKCPRCGSPARLPADDPDALIHCAACGYTFSAYEPARDATPPESDPLPRPAHSRIRVSREAADSAEWQIPPSGKSGGLLFFGILWLGIIAAITAVFIAGWATAGPKDAKDPLFVIPFASIFWAIGLAILYFGLRAKYASHTLRVDPFQITLRRTVFGRTSEKSVPRTSPIVVKLVEFYSNNDVPVKGIQIRCPSGKIRFGSALEPDEKSWLARELSLLLTPPSKPAAAAPGQRSSHFSFSLPTSGRALLGTGLVLIFFGLPFIGVAVFVMDSGNGAGASDAPVFIRLIDGLFSGVESLARIFFFAAGSLTSLLGLGLFVSTIRGSGREVRLEGNDSEVAIRTYRHGRAIHQRVFPRTEITDIRTYSSGNNNGKAMNRIELHASGKAVTLARWTDAEKAVELARSFRAAMGLPPAAAEKTSPL